MSFDGLPQTLSGNIILIVEDEEINQQFLEHFITESGAKTVIACNGKKAVDYINKGNKIDLILMDIRMPVMGGIEATKIIKSTKPEIPIIAQTAYALTEEERNYKKNGFDDFLTKPIDPNLLITKIHNNINRQPKLSQPE